jgi:hypothetical protein
MMIRAMAAVKLAWDIRLPSAEQIAVKTKAGVAA